MRPYLVITSPNGIMAFGPLNRSFLTKAEFMMTMHRNRELFKIVLTDDEANIIKNLINKKLFMLAAYNVTLIRLKRGDFVE
jgi:hypothetical protein